MFIDTKKYYKIKNKSKYKNVNNNSIANKLNCSLTKFNMLISGKIGIKKELMDALCVLLECDQDDISSYFYNNKARKYYNKIAKKRVRDQQNKYYNMLLRNMYKQLEAEDLEESRLLNIERYK